MIVVDASAIVELLVGSDRGRRVAEGMSKGAAIFAPAHVYVEVASAIGRLERAGTLSAEEAAACISSMERLPLETVDCQELLASSWFLRHRLQIADAFYVACSQLLRAPLMTSDGRLARGAETMVDIRHIA